MSVTSSTRGLRGAQREQRSVGGAWRSRPPHLCGARCRRLFIHRARRASPFHILWRRSTRHVEWRFRATRRNSRRPRASLVSAGLGYLLCASRTGRRGNPGRWTRGRLDLPDMSQVVNDYRLWPFPLMGRIGARVPSGNLDETDEKELGVLSRINPRRRDHTARITVTPRPLPRASSVPR